jgi:hypothetical protein
MGHQVPSRLTLPNIVDTKAHFTLGVKANVQLKSSIPSSGAKVEISPQGL